MSKIYSIERPDGSKFWVDNKAEALGRGSSLSDQSDGATIIVRSHELFDMPPRKLACALLNGEVVDVSEEAVIGWFSGGKRRPELER